MTILKRMGVGHAYTATLPNGDDLTVWPDYSAERTRTTLHKVVSLPKECATCGACCSNLICYIPEHQPREETHSRCDLVLRCPRQPTIACTLKLIAPGVDFGVRPDGTFPVRAYMDYGKPLILAFPHIASDIPEEPSDILEESGP